MQLHRLTYSAYGAALKTAKVFGLTGPLRRVFGPLAGRLILAASPGADTPRMIQGHRMILSSQSRLPPVAMALGAYEPATTRLIQNLVKPGMVFVDVGAHLGYYSLLAARQVGQDGRVYAFEPEPVNYSLLIKNIELNGYRNIIADPRALSNTTGSSNLFVSALDSGRHSIYHHGLPETGSVAVDTITLDAFLETQGWPRVDLVKMDVEGSERDVLEGMSQLLERSKGVKLIMEFNPALLRNAGADPIRFLEAPAGYRLKVHLIKQAPEPTPLETADIPALVDKLTKAQDSVNLFCCRE